MSSFRKAKVKVVRSLIEEAIERVSEYLKEDRETLAAGNPDKDWPTETIEKSVVSNMDHLYRLERLQALVYTGKGTINLSAEDAYVLYLFNDDFKDGELWVKPRKID